MAGFAPACDSSDCGLEWSYKLIFVELFSAWKFDGNHFLSFATINGVVDLVSVVGGNRDEFVLHGNVEKAPAFKVVFYISFPLFDKILINTALFIDGDKGPQLLFGNFRTSHFDINK